MAEPTKSRPTWTRTNSSELRSLGRRLSAVHNEIAEHGPTLARREALQRVRSRYLRLADKLCASMGAARATPDERAARMATEHMGFPNA